MSICASVLKHFHIVILTMMRNSHESFLVVMLGHKIDIDETGIFKLLLSVEYHWLKHVGTCDTHLLMRCWWS